MIYQRYLHGIYTSGDISTADYIFLIFGGMKKYVPENNKYFELPVIWMSIQMLVLSLIFSYPLKDLYSNGINVLIKYGNRKKWWLSKIIWGLIQTVSAYLIILFSICIFSLFTSALGLGIHSEYIEYYYGVGIAADSFKCTALLYGLAYSMCICVLYMAVALIMSPVVSAMIIIVYDVLSAYIMHPVLAGNAGMLLRNSSYVSDGINAALSLAVFAVVSIAALIFSLEIFGRLDIMGRRVSQED
jgi:hypothetical protein